MAYVTNLANHLILALELDNSLQDVMKSINSFGHSQSSSVNSEKSSKSEKSSEKKKTSKSEKSSEKKKTSKSEKSSETQENDDKMHKCERVLRGGNGCSKNAKRCIEYSNSDIMWFCGTEKGGCYKIKKNELEKQDERAAELKIRGSNGPKHEKKDKSETDIKASAKLAKMSRKNKFDAIPKRDKDGNRVWIDEGTRILYSKENENVYGKLTKKGEIVDLEDKDIRWAESHNIPIAVKKKQIPKKSKKKVDFDLNSESDSEDDSPKNAKKVKKSKKVESSESESSESEEEPLVKKPKPKSKKIESSSESESEPLSESNSSEDSPSETEKKKTKKSKKRIESSDEEESEPSDNESSDDSSEEEPPKEKKKAKKSKKPVKKVESSDSDSSSEEEAESSDSDLGDDSDSDLGDSDSD